MQLGMIGLGRMGAGLVRRLQRAGHECVVYDVNPAAAEGLRETGARPAGDLAELARLLTPPRAAWVMVPAAFAEATMYDVAGHFEAGDIVIDGGNSYYRDDIHRAEHLARSGIHFVDVGTSGGVFGLDRGFCLMIGGEPEIVTHLDPIFAAIAPGIEAAPRTFGRTGDPVPAERGYLHCGPHGAGHFVKMVHNGIEYGIMAAYAEGLAILDRADVGQHQQVHDAETTPLREPRYYQYDLDTAAVAEVWRRGSVIASWLLDLTAKALHDDPSLAGFSGAVSDSGEGRWTVQAAVDEGVAANVITASLYSRFSSRDESTFGNRVLSAMRKEFGGHLERATQPVAGGPDRDE
jgi:6-phosphogluconate dehydrogenase